MAQKEATLLLKIKEVGGEAISKTASALGGLKDVAMAAYAEISVAVGLALKAWHDQESATHALNQQMVTQGIYTRELSKDYHDMAAALQSKTTFADEDIVRAQAQLQAYLGQTKVTKELTQSVLDFAAAQGLSASSAASLVGKEVVNASRALSRYGIIIDDTLPKQERMTRITTELASKFGGQADAAAKGLGALTVMKNAVGEVLEAMGERLEPVVVAAANAISNFAMRLSTDSTALESFANVVRMAVQGGALMKMVFMDVAQVISQVLGTAVGGVSQMLEGQWKQAWESFKSIPSDSAAIVKGNYQQFQNDLVSIDQAFVAKKAEHHAELARMEQQAEANRQAKSAETRDLEAINDAISKEEALIREQIHQDQLAGVTLAAQLSRTNAQLMNEQSATEAFNAEQKKRILNQMISNDEVKKSEEELAKFRKAKRDAEIADQQSTFQTIAGLQRSSSKELAAIGKAAAITQIAIATPVAIAKALAAFPPPFNFVAAGLVGASMAVQAAQIAGVPLAEGGIVKATPGGVPAVIGEGGSDEAVIPLDNPEAQERLGGGGSVTVNFNGPILGDASQARDFARALDRELMRLRRDGESLAFDTRLT